MMNDRGLTLIEMIAVLLLMAIVSAVVLNRFMDITAVSTKASIETVRAHIRYAQAMAMKQNNYLWGIKCDGTDYWLFRTESKDDYATVQGDQDSPIYLPGEEDQTLPAPDMSQFVVYYDAYGRPRQYSSADGGKTVPIAAVIEITVGSEAVQISPETGFIE